tara:strand:- start:24872 stop:25897 length:1026 start_codon:yes stop_codon:yes gene_type:complete
MNSIIILTDYLNRFGSKQKSKTYRSGMDIDKIKTYFEQENFQVEVLNIAECIVRLKAKEPSYIIYTSSEDHNDKYKSFIEDIILFLEDIGHFCMPSYKYLRAHNNKVYMELLRTSLQLSDNLVFQTNYAATEEELENSKIKYPVIIKGATGALSKTVLKAENRIELLESFRKINKKDSFRLLIHQLIRRIRHNSNYKKEAVRRGKSIVQNFVPNMSYDYKVLVYFDKIFVLKRNNRKNDFRASGSGLFEYPKDIPDSILNHAIFLRKHMDLPQLSLDIALHNNKPITFEFQALYFGTKTIENAPFYFKISKSNKWERHDANNIILEEFYTKSIVRQIKSKL